MLRHHFIPCSRPVLLLSLLLAAGAPLAFAQDAPAPPPAAPEIRTFADPAHGWSLVIPQGWFAMRPDVLAEVNSMVSGEVGEAGSQSTPRFTHGLTTDPDGELSYPYMLVHALTLDLRQASYADIEKLVSTSILQEKAAEASVNTKGVTGSVADTPQFDKENNLARFELDMNLEGVGPVRAFTSMFFMRERVIQINCYALKDDAAAGRDGMNAAVQGFRVDPAARFQPAAPPAGLDTSRLVRYGLVTLLFIGLVAIPALRKLLARNSS